MAAPGTTGLDHVINYDIRATDNAGAVFERVSQKAAKAHAEFAAAQKRAESAQQAADSRAKHGFLAPLKDAFGRGSALKEYGDLLAGGGVAAGFSMIGRSLASATEKAVEFRDAMREGHESTAALFKEFLKGLPLVGGFAQAGANIRELFTGEAAALAKLNAENAKATALWDKHAKAVENLRDRLRGEKLDPELTALDNAARDARAQGNNVMAKSFEQMRQRTAGQIMQRDAQHTTDLRSGDFDDRLSDFRKRRDEEEKESRRDAWERRLEQSRREHRVDETLEDFFGGMGKEVAEDRIALLQRRSSAIGDQIELFRSLAQSSRGGTVNAGFNLADATLSQARTDRGAARDPRIDLERQALAEQKKIRENIEAIRQWIDRGAMDSPIPVLN